LPQEAEGPLLRVGEDITLRELADALLAAHRRGVAVRVLTDDRQAEGAGSRVGQLRSAGIAVQTDNDIRLHMHHKFAVVDGELLLSGSFNWTGPSVTSSYENVIVSHTPALASLFGGEFDRLWKGFGRGDAGTAKSSVPSNRVERFAVLFFPDTSGTNVGAIVDEISAAKRSIDVAMFVLTLDRLADALLEKRRQGVRVRLITDRHQSNAGGADAKRLAKAGVRVRINPPGDSDHDRRCNMHHKFAVVDSSVLISGSFNWTAQAAKGNQEDAVVYRECQELTASFAAEFQRLWDAFEQLDRQRCCCLP